MTATEKTEAKTKQPRVKQVENFIAVTAEQVEKLTKAKALSEAVKLNENIDNNAFRLGGVLKRIHENSWFEEKYPSFADYVENEFGFKLRKAQYLMTIYNELTFQQIPWEKIAHLGWTKVKELAPHLSVDNVDDWALKAKDITVAELKLLLKGAPNEDSTATTKTVSDVKPMTFKLKNDQIDTVQTALAKAKAEVNTEFDNVALENICANYLGNTPLTAPAPTYTADNLNELLAQFPIEGVLSALDKAFPTVGINVEL